MAPFATPSKEQVVDASLQAYNITKANLQTLDEAGLFRPDHLKVFAAELIRPLSKELFNVATMQRMVRAAGESMEDLKLGFIFMNALAFWFEVAGSTLGFVLGRPLPLFVFEVLYAFAVGYVLYWLVIHAEGRDYKFAAICLYVIYSLINIVQAVGALVLILPAVFFFLKTLASLSCALYAFKLRELGADPYSRMEEEVDLSVPAE